jgi:hypothetical protein
MPPSIPAGRVTRWVFAALTVAALGACAPRQPLDISEVVKSSEAGAPPEQVIGTVRSSQTTYALKGSDFCRLNRAGVPDPVLDYLQQKFFEDVDFLVRYWVLGEGLGNCSWCYPQQVDLSGLDSGAPAKQSPPKVRYGYGAPPGMPDWYEPWNAVTRRQSITVDGILGMVKSGAPEERVVQAVRSSRIEHIVATGGLGRIGTHLQIGLKGSDLARLCKEGVPESVVDALQSSVLSQYVEMQRLRYQNMGKAPGGGFF